MEGKGGGGGGRCGNAWKQEQQNKRQTLGLISVNTEQIDGTGTLVFMLLLTEERPCCQISFEFDSNVWKSFVLNSRLLLVEIFIGRSALVLELNEVKNSSHLYPTSDRVLSRSESNNRNRVAS